MTSINKSTLLKRIIAILLPLVVIGAALYIKLFYKVAGGIECATHKYFGIYCMGCGSTRQLYYALNGDFKTAFLYNVGCIIIYPAYIYIYYLVIRWNLDKKIETKHAYILSLFACILVVYMILRNIYIPIFDILRPL
jgi:hypothetical protein